MFDWLGIGVLPGCVRRLACEGRLDHISAGPDDGETKIPGERQVVGGAILFQEPLLRRRQGPAFRSRWIRIGICVGVSLCTEPGQSMPGRAKEHFVRLAIDEPLFLEAFGRDRNHVVPFPFFHYAAYTNYLDRCTGDVPRLYAADIGADKERYRGMTAKDNREFRHRLLLSPHRYVEIPGLPHAKHEELLRAFFASGQVDDSARVAYEGQVWKWEQAMIDGDRANTVGEFHAFRDEQIRHMATEFLHEHGIEPDWV